MEKIPVRQGSTVKSPELKPEDAPKLEPVRKEVASPAASRAPAGLIVLQWLTYTFWGWLATSLVWLTGMVTSHFIEGGRPVEDFMPFAIASVVVLTPVAFLCDRAYRRREGLKKSGVEMVVMIIYAVGFMLVSIGALIVTVFNGVNIAFDVVSDNSSRLASIVTAGVAALLFGLMFVWVLRPAKRPKLPAVISVGMAVVALALLVLTFVGPVAKLANLRDDRLIESNLPAVQAAINRYAEENKKLPEALSDVSFQGEAVQELARSDKLKYLPEQNSYRYQLCVEYQEELNADWLDDVMFDEEDMPYIDTSYHVAGEVCYQLSASPQEAAREGRDADAAQPERPAQPNEGAANSGPAEGGRSGTSPDSPAQSNRSNGGQSSSSDGNRDGEWGGSRGTGERSERSNRQDTRPADS